MTFVYLSEPESELTTERWRNTLESEIYQEILIGLAVDEVHCVAEWGGSSSNKIVRRRLSSCFACSRRANERRL